MQLLIQCWPWMSYVLYFRSHFRSTLFFNSSYTLRGILFPPYLGKESEMIKCKFPAQGHTFLGRIRMSDLVWWSPVCVEVSYQGPDCPDVEETVTLVNQESEKLDTRGQSCQYSNYRRTELCLPCTTLNTPHLIRLKELRGTLETFS